MSKNHIKIFDDTVLKLSINQGTEDQRTANGIGRFTSGELAFTRDTGRVFIGNYSDKEYNSSIMLPETHGGILTGNKYLGYIDSKPLSWWRNVDYVSGTHLNYDEETKFNNGGTKDSYTKESSMLGKDSKFRNRKAKDGNTYNGKWERDAVYNEKYDAYNGDYIYDMYENALILFDTNISNKSLPVTGTEDDVNYPNREQFFDDYDSYDSNNPLPIDEQYRRTRIENYNVDDVPKVYGDGYVIFRNVEPDGVTIKFKEKKFEDNGTTIKDGSAHNYSHNILTVGSVGTEAISNAFNPDHFNSDLYVSLKSDLTEIKSILNDANTFSLPQNLTLRKNVDGDTSAITLNFSETTNNVGGMDENLLTFVLSKDDNTNNYKVGIAKPSVSEFYIKLGDGLKNTGTGGPSYLKLNSMTAGDLNEYTPTISLSSEESITNIENKELSNPFISIFEDEIEGAYVGNLHVTNNGIVDKIDSYEDNYKAHNKTKIDKFESDKNLSVNYLKKPVTILWNQNGTGYSSGTTFDATTQFLLKPYFFCVNKEVLVNNATKLATYGVHDNSVYVLGNNHYKSSTAVGDYMVIPGYNFPVDNRLTGVADIRHNIGGFGKPKDYERRNNNKILKSTPGAFSTALKEVGKGGFNFETDENGDKTYIIYNKDIFDESADKGPFFNNDKIYNDIMEDFNDKDISVKSLSDISSSSISNYFNYDNLNNTQSLLDLKITFGFDDEEGAIIVKDCEEYTIRNKQKLKDGDEIESVYINSYKLSKSPYIKFEKIFSSKEIIDDLGLSYDSDYETFSSSVLSEKNNFTIAKSNYIITKNPIDDFSTFIISIYPNGATLMNDLYMPTVMRVSVYNECGISESRDVSISDKMIPNKYLTIYKKTSSQYISNQDKTVSAQYYTTSLEDSIDSAQPKFIAFVQLLKSGATENITAEEFIERCGSFCHELKKEEGYSILKIESSIFNSGFENTIANNDLKNVTQITIVIAEQKELGVEKDATYKDSFGKEIVIDDETETLNYVEYTTETHRMASIFWSEQGIHSPRDYIGTTLYIPSNASTGTTTDGDILKCEVKSNVTLRETISETSENYVVIPTHATEAILEVIHMTKSSSPISIFTAKGDYMKGLTKTIVTYTDETNYTQKDVVPTREFGTPSNENIYTEGETTGEYVVTCPSFNEDGTTETLNLMQPNKYEKCLLYSNATSSHTIRVPLYYTGYDSTKSCYLRVSGLKASSTEKVLIRLIGYVA